MSTITIWISPTWVSGWPLSSRMSAETCHLSGASSGPYHHGCSWWYVRLILHGSSGGVRPCLLSTRRSFSFRGHTPNDTGTGACGCWMNRNLHRVLRLVFQADICAREDAAQRLATGAPGCPGQIRLESV